MKCTIISWDGSNKKPHLSHDLTTPTKWQSDQSLRHPHEEILGPYSYPLSTQPRLWSDWADAQADPSLRCVHSHFVGFVMSWLISVLTEQLPMWIWMITNCTSPGKHKIWQWLSNSSRHVRTLSNSTMQRLLNLAISHFECLTHICLVDRSILINWMSPFPILGVSGVLFHFYSLSNRFSC